MRQLVWRFHPIINHLTTTTNISSLPMTPEFRAKSLTCHLVQSHASVCSSPLWVLLFSQLLKSFQTVREHTCCFYSPSCESSPFSSNAYYVSMLYSLLQTPPPTHTINVYFIHLNNSTSFQCFSLPIECNYWIP